MRSIIYNGHNFSACTSAEIVGPPQVLSATSKRVPGRAGALLVAGRVEPRVLRVRLFLDPGYLAGTRRLSWIRHGLYSWLVATDGGTLVVPGDPELTWRDVVCTGVEGWSNLFETGKCLVEFTCFDPIAYGATRTVTDNAFEVAGTWRTWPSVRLVAQAGDAVRVTNISTGEYVYVAHSFAGGEELELDFQHETVSVDGVDASADVSVASDFFTLEPGENELAFAGCSSHEVAYVERWV